MLIVLADATAVAWAVARRTAVAAEEAIAARGAFRWALSGGTTPIALFRLLQTAPWRDQIDWARVELYFADERAVPPDDPASNARLARIELAEPLGIDERRLHRMRGEAADLDAAAADYERGLDAPLDLVLLGMGPDAHVASLFPGSPLIEERTRRVAAVDDAPKPPPRRLTLTPRALDEARAVAVMCTGADKARAVEDAARSRRPPRECPASLVADREWFVDRAAAGWDSDRS